MPREAHDRESRRTFERAHDLRGTFAAALGVHERLGHLARTSLEDADNELPMSLRDALRSLLDAIATAEKDMLAIEVRLQAFLERDTRSQRLQRAGGIGLITATALSASVGDFDRFPSGRHFASSLGLTPREHSSGSTRRLGRVTKRGDVYMRGTPCRKR